MKRNPQPFEQHVGDIILIAKEEERYQDLVYSKFLILEIDPHREDGRTIKAGQFNGNPVRHFSDPASDYWTRLDFIQVDKRTINGYDFYYKTDLSKTEKDKGIPDDDATEWADLFD